MNLANYKTYKITYVWEGDFTDSYEMQALNMDDLMKKIQANREEMLAEFGELYEEIINIELISK